MRLGWVARVRPPPDVFAVVMATGIVAVAARDHQYWRIEWGLRGLASAVAVILAGGFALRVTTQMSRVVRLVRDPDVAMRMFTVVAACAVLTTCWPGHPLVEGSLLAVGAAVWVVLMLVAGVDVYARNSRQLRDQAHGVWLLPSVATQGLAILAADRAGTRGSVTLVVLAGTGWIIGLALYAVVAALIGWQALSAPMRPEQVTPDSWILMGGLAIAALSGGHILAAIQPSNAPTAAVAWCQAAIWWTWIGASVWIPVLLYAEVWRVDHLAGSLHYAGVWWAAVFPVGMYSAATGYTATVLHIPALRTVSLVFFWAAFTLWTLVAVGLVHTAGARALGHLRAGRHATDCVGPQAAGSG